MRCADEADVVKQTVDAMKAQKHALLLTRLASLLPPLSLEEAKNRSEFIKKIDSSSASPGVQSSSSVTPPPPRAPPAITKSMAAGGGKSKSIKTLGTGMSFCAAAATGAGAKDDVSAPQSFSVKDSSLSISNGTKTTKHALDKCAPHDCGSKQPQSSSSKRKALTSDSEGEENHENPSQNDTSTQNGSSGRASMSREEAGARRRKCLDDHLKHICKHLPAGALAIVLGTSGDLTEVNDMRVRRRNAAAGKGSGLPWSDADEHKLQVRARAHTRTHTHIHTYTCRCDSNEMQLEFVCLQNAVIIL